MLKRLLNLSALAGALMLAAVLLFNLTEPSAAQTEAGSGTADPFVTQITSSAQNSYAGDISGDGRFVVVESTGDIATENPDNSDGNLEVFLFDYAQRRVFQITRTRSALRTASACPTPTPTPTPSPTPTPDATPTPTPTPSPTPFQTCDIEVEVSNNKPVLSHDGRFIAFTSNATTPGDFDGSTDSNRAALSADGNQEVVLYQIPEAPAVDLTRGDELTRVDLGSGTFTRVTNTPASRTPQPGTTTVPPFTAFDNRDVALDDDASSVAFISSRNITSANGATNADNNPEVYLYDCAARTTRQLTSTQGDFVFSSNPSLSGDGSSLAFVSSANIPGAGGAAGNADGNSEVYLAALAGGGIPGFRQVTRTTAESEGVSVNIFSPGRRLSRDGRWMVFESSANLESDSSIEDAIVPYLYDVTTQGFTKVGPRSDTAGSDVLRFPTFTGDGTTIVFASALNFRSDGTVPEESNEDEGLNPTLTTQIFSAPVASPNTFTRLTNNPVTASGSVVGLEPFVSDTTRRIAFSVSSIELGGENLDFLSEVFYLHTPPRVSDETAAAGALNYFTAASRREVIPSPSPSPTPTPPAVAAFAPGMLVVIRSNSEAIRLAPESREAEGVSESRRLSLPVELAGVSVSINGAAAGLYFVSAAEIHLVVPPGLSASAADATYPLVINNNGAVLRSVAQIVAAQPDIFTAASGPGGRAAVFNITNPFFMVVEPFTVTSPDENGAEEATVLRILLTGVHKTAASEVTVRIGETDITGDAILYIGRTATPGFDQIDVRLPDTLAGAGDVFVVVTTMTGGTTASSRPSDTAPLIRIN